MQMLQEARDSSPAWRYPATVSVSPTGFEPVGAPCREALEPAAQRERGVEEAALRVAHRRTVGHALIHQQPVRAAHARGDRPGVELDARRYRHLLHQVRVVQPAAPVHRDV